MKGISILIIATLFIHIYGFSLEKPEWVTALEKPQEENASRKERILSLISDLKNRGNAENNTYEQLLKNLKNRGHENDSKNTEKWWPIPPNLFLLLKNKQWNVTDKNDEKNKISQSADDGKENSDNEKWNGNSEIEDIVHGKSNQTEKGSDQKNRRKRDSNKKYENQISSEENSRGDDSNDTNSDEDNSNDKESRRKDSSRRHFSEEDTEEDNSSDEESSNSSDKQRKQNSNDKKETWEWVRKKAKKEELKKHLEHVIEVRKKIQDKLKSNNTNHWNAPISHFHGWHGNRWNPIRQRILNICNISSEVRPEKIPELIRKCKRDFILASVNISLPWPIFKSNSSNDEREESSTKNEKNWTAGSNSTVQEPSDASSILNGNNESLSQEKGVKATTLANDKSAVSANTNTDEGQRPSSINDASVSISTSTGSSILGNKDIAEVEEEQQLENATSLLIDKALIDDGNEQPNLISLEGTAKPDDNQTVKSVSQADESVAAPGEPEAETLQTTTEGRNKQSENKEEDSNLNINQSDISDTNQTSIIPPNEEGENEIKNSNVAAINDNFNEATTELNNSENDNEHSSNNGNKTLSQSIDESANIDNEIQKSVSIADKSIAEARERISENLNKEAETDENGANVNNTDKPSNNTNVEVDSNIDSVTVTVNETEAPNHQTENSILENEEQEPTEHQRVEDDSIREISNTVRIQTEIPLANNEIAEETTNGSN